MFLPPRGDVEIDARHAFVAHVVCAPVPGFGADGLWLVKRLPIATSYGRTKRHSRHFVTEMFSEVKRNEIYLRQTSSRHGFNSDGQRRRVCRTAWQRIVSATQVSTRRLALCLGTSAEIGSRQALLQ